jgi:mono/diheme cytochrome c family protein
VRRAAAVVALTLAATGCGVLRGCTSSKPPIHLNPSMDNQPKLLPQASSDFFYDGSGMRPTVPGTVARNELHEDDAFFLGKGPDGKPVATIPVPVDGTLLERGSRRYAIYCQPCHDPRGDGKGILATRGGVPTASFHTDKVRAYPDGQLFDIVTNGSGLMPAYRWPIPPADRWAIIAHVRELQKDRAATAPAIAGATPR